MKPGVINFRNIMATSIVSLALISCSSNVRYEDASAVETTTVDFGSTDLQQIAGKLVDSIVNVPLYRQGHQ